MNEYSGLAQLVEQRTVNPLVAGSSPASGDYLTAALRVNTLSAFYF